MSRVGSSTIKIPDGVTVTFVDGEFTAKGKTQFNNTLQKVLEASEMSSNMALASATTVGSSSEVIDSYMARNLIGKDLEVTIAARPNMREFIAATGATIEDASELLYGVIGSNGDYRDWSAIMSAENPVDAARAATAQLYNSNLEYEMVQDESYGTKDFAEKLAANKLTDQDKLKQLGNFGVHKTDDGNSLVALSTSELILRKVQKAQEQIDRTAWLFGFQSQDLTNLV